MQKAPEDEAAEARQRLLVQHKGWEKRREEELRQRAIIVTGGRDYPHRDRVFRALDALDKKQHITLIIHGACTDPKTGELRGADRWADEWARSKNIERRLFRVTPDDWRRLGPVAGPLRNQRMAEHGASGCVAFSGGSGTADMVRRAEAAGIPVWRPFGDT